MTTDMNERYERWHSAARALEARGEPVTLRTVRREARGGSMTDLTAAMRAYRARNIPVSTVATNVPSILIEAARAMYKVAEDAAQQQVTEERASLAAITGENHRLQDELAEVATDIESERDTALADLQKVTVERNAACDEVLLLRGGLASLQALVDSRLSSRGQKRARQRSA